MKPNFIYLSLLQIIELGKLKASVFQTLIFKIRFFKNLHFILFLVLSTFSTVSQAQLSRSEVIRDIQTMVAETYNREESPAFRIQDEVNKVAREQGINNLSSQENSRIFSYIFMHNFAQASQNDGGKDKMKILQDLRQAGYDFQFLVPTLELLASDAELSTRADALVKLSPEYTRNLISIDFYFTIISHLPASITQEVVFRTAIDDDEFTIFLESTSEQVWQARPELVGEVLKRAMKHKSKIDIACGMQSFFMSLFENGLTGEHQDPIRQRNQLRILENLKDYQAYQDSLKPIQHQSCESWGQSLESIFSEIQDRFIVFQRELASYPVYLTASPNKSGQCSIKEFQSWKKIC